MNKTIKKIATRLKVYLNLNYQLQRKLKGKKVRGFFTKLSSRFKPKSNLAELSPKTNSMLLDLNESGLSMLGMVLEEDKLQRLLERLDGYKLHDRFRPEEGFFNLNNVPASTHVADYFIDDWSKFPEALELANNKPILDVAAQYLECKPTISNLQIWWSFPGHDKPEQAEFFHRDVDDWKFFKLFIYLTDVDDESGPHVYVLGSKNKLQSLTIRRYSDDEISNLFGAENIKVLSGRKGEGFLEDTFGFHKGELPKSRRRLLLQVQYSINPIKIKTYSPSESKINYDSYINRLYFK